MTSLQELTQAELRRISALAKLLAHPLRLRIAIAMSAGDVTSASNLAEAFDEKVTTVAYHVRALYRGGALRLVAEGQVRGATEHFYLLSPEVWDELSHLIGALNTALRASRGPATEWWSLGITVPAVGA